MQYDSVAGFANVENDHGAARIYDQFGWITVTDWLTDLNQTSFDDDTKKFENVLAIKIRQCVFATRVVIVFVYKALSLYLPVLSWTRH